jgi:hypothetical protein
MTVQLQDNGYVRSNYNGTDKSIFVDMHTIPGNETGDIGVSVDHVVLESGKVIPRVQGAFLASLHFD